MSNLHSYLCRGKKLYNLHFCHSVKASWVFFILLTVHSIVSAQVDSVGVDKFVMNINGNALKIPYYANYSLEVIDSSVIHAVVVVHGKNRNANDYFANMKAAAAMRPAETDSTLIIAPQFLTESDIDFHSLDSEHLYWSSDGWKSGSKSKNNTSNPRPERIASFAVLDSLLLKLAVNFPNLQSIVFTGHSSGAKLTNRYSGTTPMANTLCNEYRILMKYIVANSSSYMYLDGKRRVGSSVDTFAIPDSACVNYDDWSYGLNNLYTYASNAGADSIRSWLEKREVVYLLGENDNDPNASTLVTNCQATWQGDHRLERGSVYYNYLEEYYGSGIVNRHTLDTVPGVGHNNYDMYTSSIGLYHLFESNPDTCNNCDGSSNDGTIYTYYRDADADGYGDPYDFRQACHEVFGYVRDSSDCDDHNSAVHPAAAEICFDGIDNDCDGVVDCVNCNYETIDYNDFEVGFGIWNDGGSDCAWSSSNAYSGTYSIRLRDNTSSSVLTSNILDLSSYDELAISFSYFPVSMDNSNEDFWLQMSNDGGSTYTTVEDWRKGIDFENDLRYFDTIIINGPFTGSMMFRFRCDASSNYDWVYLDDIHVQGCFAGPNCNDGIQNGDETGIDCGGPDCAPCTGGCAYELVNNEDFESNYGIWNDGGGDCYRSASNANSGSYSIRLRDNSGSASSMTTDNLNFTNYDEARIEFSYYPIDMENGEDFFLEVSTDGGTSFTLYREWNAGSEFQNDTRYFDTVFITGVTFTANTQFRFRCDASNNSDQIYVDDVEISGCSINSNYVRKADEEMEQRIESEILSDREMDFTLFPVPTRDILSIRFKEGVPYHDRIVITDFSGKIVRTVNYKGTNIINMDISRLEVGIYQVIVFSDDYRQSLTKRFVKVQ